MKNWTTLLFTVALFIFTTNTVYAQRAKDIAANIIENNLTVRAYRAQAEAVRADNHTGLTLADPEVEFIHKWSQDLSSEVIEIEGEKITVPNFMELSVTQSFDFATLLGAKRRLARSKDELAEIEYQQAMQLMALNVNRLLINLSCANEIANDWAKRIEFSNQLEQKYRTAFKAGDIGRLEYNKTLLELTSVHTDYMKVLAEQQAAIRALQAAGLQDTIGLTSLIISEQDVENVALMYGSERSMTHAQSLQKESVARAEVKLAKSESLPVLSVGYAAEYMPKEYNYHGLLVGMSLPLWANKGNVKRAKAQLALAQAEAADQTHAIEMKCYDLKCRTEDSRKIAETLHKASEELVSVDVLRKSLDSGDIDIIQYLADHAALYNLHIKYHEAERDYLLLFAEYCLVK